ncbi:MAG: DNA mismatch repair protein MutS, partial [Terriglobales bacterium]
GTSPVRTRLEPWVLDPEFAVGVLESHFGLLSLEAFGLTGKPWAATAAGAIVHYVKDTQRSPLAHVDRLAYFERGQGLVLDAVTVRNLELVDPLFPGVDATLRAAIDATVTPMGKRLVRQWILRPSTELGEIQARQAAVAALLADFAKRQLLRTTAARVQDLERLLSRVALDTALPRDLLALSLSLDQIPELQQTLGTAASERLTTLAGALDPCDELRAAFRSSLADDPPATLADGGYIRAGMSAELDQLRDLSRNAKGAIAQIEAQERARTGITSLKVRFNNIFGYYIEVSKSNLKLVPGDFERKQTLVNAERFTTPALKELEVRVLTADEQAHALE